MNVWVAMPCYDVHKAAMAKRKWQSRGYKVAFFFDVDRESVDADKTYHGKYGGYWNACNQMAKDLVAKEGADIVVFAADDIDPDQSKTADEIGREFLERFPDGALGVMQPCGDLQGIDGTGKPAAARICGSPWFSKSWIERGYGGKGPVDSRFWHFYGDEALKEVAERLGCLWMRPDLTQFHRHWSWNHQPQEKYQDRNATLYWEKDRALFFAEKELGFPGSEPLPCSTPTKT